MFYIYRNERISADGKQFLGQIFFIIIALLLFILFHFYCNFSPEHTHTEQRINTWRFNGEITDLSPGLSRIIYYNDPRLKLFQLERITFVRVNEIPDPGQE